MKYLILFAILYCSLISNAQIKLHHSKKKAYRPDWHQAAGWTLVGFGGLFRGLTDGYVQGGRRYYEIHYDADPYGFWGSQSYQQATLNPNFWNKHMGTFDVYHVGGDLSKIFYISGGIVMTIGEKKPWWHYALNFGVGLFVNAGTERLGHWIMTK